MRTPGDEGPQEGRTGLPPRPSGGQTAAATQRSGPRVGRRTLSGRGARARGRADGGTDAAVGDDRSGPAGTDAVETARQICLDQLSFAPRTRAELAAVLAQRGVPDEAADEVLGRFTEVGLVDDEAFARAWVTSRSTGKGLARRALSQELRRRGVEEQTVTAAVETVDPEQEVATARALVARRLPATAGLDPAARARRLVGLLARKGYPAGTAYRVVREALAEEGAEVALDTDGLSALD